MRRTCDHSRKGGVLALLAVACSTGPANTPAVRQAAALAGVPAAAAPVLSRFDVPLAYDFTDVIANVEREIPRTFGSLDSLLRDGDDDRKQYAFTATRGAFTAFAEGSEVHLRTTFSYSARGYYKPFMGPTLSAGCGKGAVRPQVVAELVAPITLTPSWHLKAKSRIARLEPATSEERDRCRISVLSIDVTKRVVDAARHGLQDYLPRIDARVGHVDLTRMATEWWEDLSRPMKVADGVFLVLHPRQLRLKGFTGSRHVLNVEVGMDAFPVVVTGQRPPADVPPLPPLGHDSGGTGFRVSVDGTVDYATASRALTSELRGKEVNIGRRTLRVESLAASRNAAGRLALSVAFTGDAVGTLQLVGTPRFNAATDHLDVDDLAFDLTTDSRLMNAYAWLRSDALLASFRDKMTLPAAPALAHGGRRIEEGLNRTIGGVLTMRATVDSMVVVGVYVTSLGVTVRALVIGTGRVVVTPKQRRAP